MWVGGTLSEGAIRCEFLSVGLASLVSNLPRQFINGFRLRSNTARHDVYIVMTVLVGALSIWFLAMGRSPSDDDTDYDDSSVAPVPYCLAAEDTAVGQAS
jgi:hypothetical protein